MLLGHYGIAFAAKRVAPNASLGVYAFAAEWLDLLWPVLLLTGIEQVRIAPGLMRASSLDFTHYPISHSLLLAIMWGVLLAVGYYARRRSGRAATVVGLLVVSHWLLDLPMHRPDLPLWPGSARVGFGLWDSIVATLAIELLLFVGGLLVYVRATRARDAVGKWALYALVGFLLLIFFSGFAGPPPSERAVAIGALGLWLLAPWAHWIDRHRELLAV